MINIDFSMVIQIVNFIILIWILNLLLYKPIRGILAQRKEKVVGIERNIESFKEEAKDKDEAYARGVRDARAEGMKEKEAIIQTAAEEEKKIVRQINERAQSELAEVRSRIEKEVETVRSNLDAQVDDFAGEITQKVLGRAV